MDAATAGVIRTIGEALIDLANAVETEPAEKSSIEISPAPTQTSPPPAEAPATGSPVAQSPEVPAEPPVSSGAVLGG